MKFPLTFEYDAEQVGDRYRTTQAAIYDAEGKLIVEEPGPEATWRDLEVLVEMANIGWKWLKEDDS